MSSTPRTHHRYRLVCQDCGAGIDVDDRAASPAASGDAPGLTRTFADAIRAGWHAPGQCPAASGDALDRWIGPLARADRWIVGHWTGEKDHACGECVPDGPMVEPGFQCAPHAAFARLASREGAE